MSGKPRDAARAFANRSIANRRHRRASEAMLGNTRSLRHGIFARVHNMPDVAVEVGLVFATHPHLDPLADGRLVEELALAFIQRRRAIEALAEEGWTSTLTSYERGLAAQAERLEKAVHERDRERAAVAARGRVIDLTRWQPEATEGQRRAKIGPGADRDSTEARGS